MVLVFSLNVMLHIAMLTAKKSGSKYIPKDCNANYANVSIGDHILNLKWILYENGNTNVRGVTGKTRYPQWRILGGLLGQKVYTKSKITLAGAEDLFWSLITLMHMMSKRWETMTMFKYKYAEYLGQVMSGSEGYGNVFMVFPWWELSVILDDVEYILKYKPHGKGRSARICIWTESKNASKYISEFVPNIQLVPAAVKYMMDCVDADAEDSSRSVSAEDSDQLVPLTVPLTVPLSGPPPNNIDNHHIVPAPRGEIIKWFPRSPLDFLLACCEMFRYHDLSPSISGYMVYHNFSTIGQIAN